MYHRIISGILITAFKMSTTARFTTKILGTVRSVLNRTSNKQIMLFPNIDPTITKTIMKMCISASLSGQELFIKVEFIFLRTTTSALKIQSKSSLCSGSYRHSVDIRFTRSSFCYIRWRMKHFTSGEVRIKSGGCILSAQSLFDFKLANQGDGDGRILNVFRYL